MKLQTPKPFFRVLKHADLNSKMICSFSLVFLFFLFFFTVLSDMFCFLFSTFQKSEDATKLQTCYPGLKENQGRRAAIERSSCDNTRYTVPIKLLWDDVGFTLRLASQWLPRFFPKPFLTCIYRSASKKWLEHVRMGFSWKGLSSVTDVSITWATSSQKTFCVNIYQHCWYPCKIYFYTCCLALQV